nr:MAG TPA: hypothetical protein [Caudoviricetes sp.]
MWTKTPTGTPFSVTPSPTDRHDEPRPVDNDGAGFLIPERKEQMTCLVFMLTICLLVVVWTNFND